MVVVFFDQDVEDTSCIGIPPEFDEGKGLDR